jgi:F0F1-type ATP synthase membrane subunit c/vacuolar-type H+-ATPase subunit K
MAVKMEAILRTLRILWGAQLAVPPMFLVVLVIQQRAGTLPTDPPFVMLPAFAAVGVALLIASFVVPRILHRSAVRQARLKVEDVPDDEPQLFRTAPKTIRLFADPETARIRGAQLTFVPFILGVAMAEAVACFGLVLGMIGFRLVEVAPFFLLGFVVIASRFPSEARMMRALEAAAGARLRRPTEPA